MKLIKNDTFFAGDFEISQSVFLFNLNIAIYRKIGIDNNISYKFVKYYENNTKEKNDNFLLLILLYEEKYKHYQQIMYKDNKNIILKENNSN